MSDRQRSVTRRGRLKTIRRKAEVSALAQLDVVVRKLRRAASQGETITLLPSAAEMIVRLYEITTSKRAVKVGPPELLATFHLWMAIDAFWRRDGGKVSVKVANSLVAQEWRVSIAMVEKIVRDHGIKAQEWLAQFGDGDRKAIGDNVAIWASVYRDLGISRSLLRRLRARAIWLDVKI